MTFRTSIEKAWSFLKESQLAEGRFPDFLAFGEDFSCPTIPELSVFSTSAILLALADCPLADKEAVVGAGLDFLEGQMGPYQSWSFWHSAHPWTSVLPTDLDDTALASLLLTRANRLLPNNYAWMLANRKDSAAFYTWVGPRWNASAPWSWWRLVLRRFKRPLLCWLFWTKANCLYWDIDSVVNANVLLYFAATGHQHQATGCIDFLTNLVKTGREHCSDKWYHGPWPFHYSLARAHRFGASALSPLKPICLSRILEGQEADGSFGLNVLHTSQAISALRWWDYSGPEVSTARHYLLRHQLSDGSWPRLPFYFGGPSRQTCWGSESLTTALCLEALTL